VLKLKSNCNPFKTAKQADGEVPWTFAYNEKAGVEGGRLFYRVENHNGILVVV
jgi:hypothetical protein